MPFVMKKVAMRLRNNSEYIPLPGVRGEAGPAGPGVPTGGTTGQVLAKASNADNDTEWVNQSGGGGTSDYDDLTDKPSINNVTLSGNKTAEDLSLGTYSKPSGGIPASDLASAVQTSLGKADTALQSVPATYRTAAAQDSIDATQDAAIGVVITGKRPSMAVDAGQYVIVRNSTISGITDGLYTANAALSPSTDVTAANLTAVSGGGLNSLSALIDAKHVSVWPTPTGYDSVQDIVDVMSALPTNSFLLNTFGSDLRTDLFTTASSYNGFIVCFKASSNNIYYLAYSRDVAGTGNINIPNVNVSIKHSLL